RRLLDVGRFGVPLEQLPALYGDRVPSLVRLLDAVVHAAEGLGVHGRLELGGDLVVGRPQVLEVDGLAVGVLGQRLVGDVDVDGTGQGVRHYQRRAGQVVGPDVRVDAALEVAVARQ